MIMFSIEHSLKPTSDVKSDIKNLNELHRWPKTDVITSRVF